MEDDEKLKNKLSPDEPYEMTMDEIEEKISRIDGDSRPQGDTTSHNDISPLETGHIDDTTSLNADDRAEAQSGKTWGLGENHGGYGKILDILDKHQTQADEDDEKIRKRERRDMLIRAIGDGISAIAGLAGSAAGAPGTVNHEISLTKSGTELRDKIRKEREKRRELYTQRALAAARIEAQNRRTQSMEEKARQQAELQRYKAEGDIEIARQRLAMAQSKEEFEQNRKEALLELTRQKNEADAQYKTGMLSVAQYNAKTSRIRAESDRIRAAKYQSGSAKGGADKGTGTEKETAAEWMFRMQDEDPEGYREAAEGALGYYNPHPTSAQAGQIRSYYKAKHRRRESEGEARGASTQPGKHETARGKTGAAREGGKGIVRKGKKKISL